MPDIPTIAMKPFACGHMGVGSKLESIVQGTIEKDDDDDEDDDDEDEGDESRRQALASSLSFLFSVFVLIVFAAQSAPRKRKAGIGTNNYYNKPATQGTPAATTPNARGAMATPTSRASYCNYTRGKDHGAASGSKSANENQSLSSHRPPPSRRAHKASKAGKGKKRQRTAPSGEDDMKAAATLTSLLFHSRPQGQGPPSAGSDSGSAHSWTQFGSSHRAPRAPPPPLLVRATPNRSRSRSSRRSHRGLPHPRPPNLNLSRSPHPSHNSREPRSSPPRPTTKPRTSCSSSPPHPPPPGPARRATKPPSAPLEPALAEEQGHKRNHSGEGSFGSGAPWRLAAAPTLPNDKEENGSGGSANVVPPRTPPQAQLLPPPPLPQSQQSPLPRTHSSPGKTATTPGSSFNLGDFINVSPMPSAGAGARERRLFGKIYALALFLYCRSS
ncbi:hypothetical protein PLICRDRAFT_179044 [Plicaturopsis crispa FD-325 SS-3]|uniref:Uncharacterized protein n=1 Tax=Plicaturopsis crispa FD-325 SS-3 TaxID=944288 RepID=A0A0C9TAI6_PLICR|nr:hypothetical protein PLICRDRAFT_179044 [Plicaturopsis crispa FD-325 SS-3]